MCVCVRACARVCLVNSKVSGVVAVGCRLFPGDGDRGTGTRSQRGRVGGPRVQFPRGRLQSVQLPGAVALRLHIVARHLGVNNLPRVVPRPGIPRLQSVQLPGAVAQTAAGRRRPDEHHGQRQRTVLGD